MGCFVTFSVVRGESEPSHPKLSEVAAEVAPHLRSPPPRHGQVDVRHERYGDPSIMTDSRGAVHNLEISGFRFNVLVSEAGALRSGDVHMHDQYDMIFSGRGVHIQSLALQPWHTARLLHVRAHSPSDHT